MKLAISANYAKFSFQRTITSILPKIVILCIIPLITGCETFYSIKREAAPIHNLTFSCLDQTLRTQNGINIFQDNETNGKEITNPQNLGTIPPLGDGEKYKNRIYCYTYKSITGGCIYAMGQEDQISSLSNELRFWTHGSPPPQEKIDQSLTSMREVGDIIQQHCNVPELKNIKETYQ